MWFLSTYMYLKLLFMTFKWKRDKNEKKKWQMIKLAKQPLTIMLTLFYILRLPMVTLQSSFTIQNYFVYIFQIMWYTIFCKVKWVTSLGNLFSGEQSHYSHHHRTSWVYIYISEEILRILGIFLDQVSY